MLHVSTFPLRCAAHALPDCARRRSVTRLVTNQSVQEVALCVNAGTRASDVRDAYKVVSRAFLIGFNFMVISVSYRLKAVGKETTCTGECEAMKKGLDVQGNYK